MVFGEVRDVLDANRKEYGRAVEDSGVWRMMKRITRYILRPAGRFRM